MDLSANTSLAGIAEAVASVLVAASRAGCQVYIAGALARDLWLEFGHGVATGRRTADIDFGVQCADWPTFERLAQELVGMTLKRNDRVQHRFRHSNGTEIDLIPYGGIEGTNRELAWPPDGNPVLSVLGFSEVAHHTVDFVLPGGVTVPVVSLQALAVLKLLAFGSRTAPERRKDADDLIRISEHYLDVREPRLPIEDEEALLQRNEFVTSGASAELLGRDMAAFASEDVRAFISRILERECDPEGPLNLAQSRSGTDPLAHLGLVSALRSGFLLAT
jgi:predicted nucleotidyltransferase